MRFGICLPIRLDADAGTNVDIAKRAEALGFDSVAEKIISDFEDD